MFWYYSLIKDYIQNPHQIRTHASPPPPFAIGLHRCTFNDASGTEYYAFILRLLPSWNLSLVFSDLRYLRASSFPVLLSHGSHDTS